MLHPQSRWRLALELQPLPHEAFSWPVIVGLGPRSLFSVQCIVQLLLLLLPLCKPLLDLLFKLCVWSDLVHGERAPVERVCLITERQGTEGIIWTVPVLEIKRGGEARRRQGISETGLQKRRVPEEVPGYS